MKTAYIEATYLSELLFMIRCLTTAALGDMVIVLLMMAALIL